VDYRPMARRHIETAKRILAKRSYEEWQKPEHIATYKFLTEHVIPEAENFLKALEEQEKMSFFRQKELRSSKGETEK